MICLNQLFSNPTKPSVFGITDVIGLKFLTQLRIDLNDLKVHRFCHGFTNCHSPICVCGTENDSTSYFLHRCPRFSNQHNELYTKIRSLDAGDSFFYLLPDDFTTALLYGINALTTPHNKFILEATIDFIRKSKRFDKLEAFA